MISVIVITHGLFGQELLRTAQDIVGRQEQVAGLAVLPDTGGESLGLAISETLQNLASSEGHLFLVDMLGGTPCNQAMVRTRGVKAEVVAGVNLYMVLSALRNREGADLKSLASRVAEDGKRAIVSASDLLAKKLEAK